MTKITHTIHSAGFVGQKLCKGNAKNIAVQQIIMQEVVNKRKNEIMDIISGMEMLFCKNCFALALC